MKPPLYVIGVGILDVVIEKGGEFLDISFMPSLTHTLERGWWSHPEKHLEVEPVLRPKFLCSPLPSLLFGLFLLQSSRARTPQCPTPAPSDRHGVCPRPRE